VSEVIFLKNINASNIFGFINTLNKKPDARALLNGSHEHPHIRGDVKFHNTPIGILVVAEVFGLPSDKSSGKNKFFGFHIHEGLNCSGNSTDSFADTLGHYNPQRSEHPYHAGDLPPLFENSGYAFSAFLTNRFSLSEVIGKTVVIHSMPDDFTSQPSGMSGKKISCGKILNFS